MEWLDTTRMTFLLRLRDRADQMSWDLFHERYGELLYRYARTRGATHEDAEDIVQEVELYLFKALDGFEYDARKGRFRSYLRTAALHAMGKGAASHARKIGILVDPRDFDFLKAEQEADADLWWDHEWRMHRLRTALRHISVDFEPRTLRAFELHVLAGIPVAQVALELEVGERTVYAAKARVLKRLRKQLTEMDPHGDD